MSQGQPHAIKYGDVFRVGGDLAPQDASMMQSAENLILGQTQKGGPAAVMQSAATYNERAGAVRHTDLTVAAANEGMTVTETDLPGRGCVITEVVAGQVVGQYVRPDHPAGSRMAYRPAAIDDNMVTIGEALEASALTAGDKPVDQSDAAAIQAAEVRATGDNRFSLVGLAATAQSAAVVNEKTAWDEYKTKLGDVLNDATARLPADKPVTREDVEGVVSAETRNKPGLASVCGSSGKSQPSQKYMTSIRAFLGLDKSRTKVPCL